MATSTTSEARVENTGKRVLKSLAGSVTLIGALLVFLHLRYDKKISFFSRKYVGAKCFYNFVVAFSVHYLVLVQEKEG